MKDFNNLFQQAVALKSQEMQSKRRVFEQQPIFIKAGLYYLQKYEEQRKLDFDQRFKLAESLKDQGNQLFKEGQYDKAAHEYEQALSIFRYIENKNTNWKKEGIIDDDLIYRTFNSEEEEKRIQVSDLEFKIYLNMATCYFKDKKYDISIKACDFSLQIKPTSKGYFRRAKARLSQINISDDDYKSAIFDLTQAQELDPQEVEIKSLLHKTQVEIKQKDSQMKEMYQRMLKRSKLEEEIKKAETYPLIFKRVQSIIFESYNLTINNLTILRAKFFQIRKQLCERKKYKKIQNNYVKNQ